MKAKFITVLVLGGLFVTASKTCACIRPPVANLTVDPEYVRTDVNVTCDGSASYDPDGSITKYEWDFYWDPNTAFDCDCYETSQHQTCDNDDLFDGKTIYQYDTAGVYKVILRVTNNDGITDLSPIRTVYVYEDNTPLYVDENTTCTEECDGSTWAKAFTYLQDALAVAQPTDKIWVAEGTYYPDQNSTYPNGSGLPEETFQLVHYVQIYGGFPTGGGNWESRDPKAFETVLGGDLQDDDGPDFTNRDDNSYNVVTGADNAILDGFTITSGNANGSFPDNLGGGIYCKGVSPTVSNCVIRDNWSNYFGGGMGNYNGSHPTVTNCFFIDNKSVDGAGMGNMNSSHPTLTNCVFSGNYATRHGGGIRNISSASVTLINCTFSKNHAGSRGGGLDDGIANSPVTNCIFWGNTASYGKQIMWSPVVKYSCIQDEDPYADPIPFGGAANGNTDDDPKFVDADDPAGSDGIFGTLDDGLRLMAESPCIDTGDNNAVPAGITTDIKGDDRINGIVDMGAYEYIAQNVFYVDKDAEGNNDGTSWDDAFTDLQDALASSGEEIWVAEGIYKPGISRSSTFQLVEGVGLYGGFASTEAVRNHRDWVAHETTLSGDIGTPGVDTDNSYHVVTGEDGAIIDGFTITGGNADGSGNNCYGGGMYNSSSSPTVANCIFSDNTADYDGGGMYNYYSSATVINCIFRDNTAINSNGGGMYNYSYNYYSSPTVVNCIFSDNTAYYDGGGMCNYASSATTTNCIFSNNTAGSNGGGMYNYYEPSTVVNCSFSGNYASNDGGGISNWYAGGTLIRNCILWGNGDEISNGAPATIRISYCDINGCGGSTGWDTNFGADDGGNIDTDPCFVDVDYNNFHLDPNHSVCIDAGFPLYDYSNEPSPDGNRINMGAYGNTSEAAITIDEDDDGLPDAWQRYHWSDYDPNDPDPNHDRNHDFDDDGFSNWVEYLFGYDPNGFTEKPLDLVLDDLGPLSSTVFTISQFDPVKGEAFTINYLLNMNADVNISFINTDTAETVKTISNTVTAGLIQAVWDGTGDDGWIVERYFYDVNIDADDGDYTWTSLDGETSHDPNLFVPFGLANYFEYDYNVDSNDFDPHKNIPAKIECRITYPNSAPPPPSPHQWWTRSIDIVKVGHSADYFEGNDDDRIYHLVKDRLLEPGWNTFYWYGRWGDDVNDPNAGPDHKICKEPFDVYFDVGGNVTSGVVLVYYEEPISNLRCNPYRILPIIDEVTTITYDLSCNANVTIDIYDPDGSYFGTLLKDEPQTAGLKKVVWYGKEDGISSDPETNYDPNLRYIDDEGVYLTEHDPNMRYITDEGVYRIEVGIDDVNEMLEGAITVYK